jgi:hypothetical protein
VAWWLLFIPAGAEKSTGTQFKELVMRKQDTIIDNAKEATMKFYNAGYSGFDPGDMDYKKMGGDKDLYILFPELKEVISRYQIKNIDLRFSNGYRLRVYDICKASSRNLECTADDYYAHQPGAAVCMG